MTDREQPPYPAGYHPVPDDDWRETTTPGLTPVSGQGSTALSGSSGLGSSRLDPSDEPRPYQQPPSEQYRYQQPPSGEQGYGQHSYGQHSYDQPSYGTTGYGQTGYGTTGDGTTGDGTTGDGTTGDGRQAYDQRADDQQAYGQPGYGQTGYGQTGYGDAAYGRPGAPATATAPDYSSRPVAVRRADALASLALLLAGIAAAVSLPLTWIARSERTGLTLLLDGFHNLDALFRTGLWQPLAIILGGGLLFLLGLFLLIPARTHRTLGLLALLVTCAVGAGVLVPLADANWRLGVFDVGFYCGIAVAGFGLIGSLKALLTGPRMR